VVRRDLTFSQQGKLGSHFEDEELLWLGARALKKVSWGKWVVVLFIALIVIGVVFLGFREVQKREALRSCEINLVDVSVKNTGLTSTTLDKLDYDLYGNGKYLGDWTITSVLYFFSP